MQEEIDFYNKLIEKNDDGPEEQINEQNMASRAQSRASAEVGAYM